MIIGGKRQGAGRKPKAETAAVRVPVAGALVARRLVEFVIQKTRGVLLETEWYRTAPDRFKSDRPEVKIIGIEDREICMSEGTLIIGHRMGPHIIAETVMGGIGIRFSVALEVGRLGASIEDEYEVADYAMQHLLPTL